MSDPAPLQLGSSNARSCCTDCLVRGIPCLPRESPAHFHLAKRRCSLTWIRKLSSLSNIDPKWPPKIYVWTPTATLSGSEIGIARVERYDAKKNVIPGTQGSIRKNPQGYYELVQQANKLVVDCPYDLVVLDTLSTTVEHLQRLICYHHQVSTFTLPLWGVFATDIEEPRAGLLGLPCRKIFHRAHPYFRERKYQ